MAAVTTSAIGIGVSGYMAYQGAQDKKDGQNKLDNYDRNDLVNPYKEGVRISTEGTDLMREESQRTSANMVDASKDAGIRGIMGVLPRIQEATNAENRDAQKILDDQVQRRDYAIAGDETNLRAMKENRDNNNIAALSSQVEAGKQDMWNGITGVAKSTIYGANNIDFSTEREPVEPVGDNLKPVGLTSLDKYKTKDPWALNSSSLNIK